MESDPRPGPLPTVLVGYPDYTLAGRRGPNIYPNGRAVGPLLDRHPQKGPPNLGKQSYNSQED